MSDRATSETEGHYETCAIRAGGPCDCPLSDWASGTPTNPEATDHATVIRAYIEGSGYEVVTMGDGHPSAVPMDDAPVLAALHALLTERDALKEEVEIDSKLIAERDRILDACPCPVHGRCVPHVLDELATLTRYRNALDVCKHAIQRTVMRHGYPEEAKADLREAHSAILAALDGPKEETT